MMGMLNVGSIVLGLLAWVLPIVNLLRYNKDVYKSHAVLSVMSLSVCAVSICFQIYYTNHLVMIADWTALMDTMGTVAVAATVLLIGTLLLNAISLVVYRRQTTK